VLRSSGSKHRCGSRGFKISLSCSSGVWRGSSSLMYLQYDTVKRLVDTSQST
jgi:hypothetical protein